MHRNILKHTKLTILSIILTLLIFPSISYSTCNWIDMGLKGLEMITDENSCVYISNWDDFITTVEETIISELNLVTGKDWSPIVESFQKIVNEMQKVLEDEYGLDIPFQFYIADDMNINAFAIGKTVVVNKGLLYFYTSPYNYWRELGYSDKNAKVIVQNYTPWENEIEAITFVIAHEVAHNILLHSKSTTQLACEKYLEYGEKKLKRAEAPKKKEKWYKKLGKKLEEGVRLGFEGLLNSVEAKQLSQSNEYDADALALYILYKSGLDPFEGVKALEILSTLSESPTEISKMIQKFLCSTHPEMLLRIEHAREIAEHISKKGKLPQLPQKTDAIKTIERYAKLSVDKTISNYTKTIEKNPKDVDAIFGRGLLYYEKGDYDKAISDYAKVIELNPKIADAYYNRGLAYSAKELYDEAIKDFTFAIKLNPAFEIAYYHRGNCYKSKRLYDEAIKDYTIAIDLNPEFTDAYYSRGCCYFVKELDDKAISDYTKTIRLDPYYQSAYYFRGWLYHEKGLFDKAISDFTKAIELDANDKDSYFRRGLAFSDKKLYDKAIEDFTKAIEINPEFAEAYYQRGLIYYNKGLKKSAITDLTKAVDLGYKEARESLKKYFNIDY